MAVKVDYVAQDSDALLVAIKNHRSAMDEKRFSNVVYTNFLSAKENLRVKEVAQQTAVKTAEDKTALQDFYFSEITRTIKVIRKAVKSAYEEDAQKMSLFRVDDPIPKTVKGLRPMCEYLTKVTSEDSEVLLQNGLVESDITDLGMFLTGLIAADAEQENTKQLQVAATKARDNAAKELKALCLKIRNFTDACFSKNPEILLEFKPIPKGRGGKGKPKDDKTPPDEPTPPAGQ